MDNGSDLTEAKRNQTKRERLGLRPIINVSTTMTAPGGSIMVPEAILAMAVAERSGPAALNSGGA
ncbi:aromatic amino acid beta-eliminating lyase/threonine aldolase [Allomesorhizobium alhagi]|uniref:Aromatic amino acid beta-eliminating lyase/threonine aldolase n=1 Tax=Mesorhizobium alhagi CCNWXJ12-2 TaxID=1107882 RepID=H0HYB8_9HYPH|nr:aromatic amino acid beta-eliminating lyase/threonine aldolase [Mesorhizobium alhagi]EHK54256.1 aromatic amino acid beta-eliminating lyase/threonine aldolase [Mesorhizobium alhagi CCNWXJ12-2]